MKARFFSLIASLFILLSPVFSATCDIPPIKKDKLLSMSYDEFDQTDNGWRQYVKLGCYHEMATLLDQYLNQKNTTLADWQIISITWHAGQMYAFNNEYEIAKIRFGQSINPHEPEDTPILWNDYVYATIAFLAQSGFVWVKSSSKIHFYSVN